MSFTYFPLNTEELNKRAIIWDALYKKKPFTGIAVHLYTIPDLEECIKKTISVDKIPLANVSTERNQEWDDSLRNQIHTMHAQSFSRYQSDKYPAIDIPRSFFGQTQALVEIFGGKIIPAPSEPGLFHAVPLIESVDDIAKIKIKPVNQCLYGNAVKFAKYAYESTEGQLSIKNPVMPGPIDMVTYLIGSLRVMQWIFDEPEALHKMLEIATEQLIEVIHQLQKATDGNLAPDIQGCIPKCFSLCSESRHMLSSDAYIEFEGAYLRKIGEACGPYAYHGCGTYERVLDYDMQDPNLKIIHFQTKEMDLTKVYDITKGTLPISIGRSINLHERYLWPNEKTFLSHVLSVFPGPALAETGVFDVDAFFEAYNETGGDIPGRHCGIRVLE